MFEAVALVDDFAADRVPVKIKSKHDLAVAVNERIADQLCKHKLQITQLFWCSSRSQWRFTARRARGALTYRAEG